VLIVDGGRRLRLHDAFAADARYGLVETLVGEMPLLTVVQTAGIPGVYLLAHGHDGGEPSWGALGRLLADARPHFGRVILALEPAAPSSLGDILRGRVLEGWWADREATLSRVAEALQERVGIALTALDLNSVPRPTLEAMVERVRALRTEFGPSIAEVAPLQLPTPELPAAAPPPEAVVLDCDLQVRERLRFLIWMRRVQAESPSGVAQPQTR
jgi:hypothetical protein